MANRYQSGGDRFAQDRDDRNRSRQQEQFYSDRDSQYGESGGGQNGGYQSGGYQSGGQNSGYQGGGDYAGGTASRSGYTGRSGGGWQDRTQSSSGGYDPMGEYDRGGDRGGETRNRGGGGGGAQYDTSHRQFYDYNAPRETHSTFRGDDYGGGAVYGASSGGGSAGASGGYALSPGYAGMERDRSGGGGNNRGFIERAGDEIASWFGDHDAEQRRERDHSGRGPSNYTRSDQRILEDACDRLTEDRYVDASDVTVTVEGGEVTLTGTVSNRQQKRRAEDCVDNISGVGHVQNNLRVNSSMSGGSTTNTTSTDGSSGSLV